MPARVVRALVRVCFTGAVLLCLVGLARYVDVEERAPLKLSIDRPVAVEARHHLGHVSVLVEYAESGAAAREAPRRLRLRGARRPRGLRGESAAQPLAVRGGYVGLVRVADCKVQIVAIRVGSVGPAERVALAGEVPLALRAKALSFECADRLGRRRRSPDQRKVTSSVGKLEDIDARPRHRRLPPTVDGDHIFHSVAGLSLLVGLKNDTP